MAVPSSGVVTAEHIEAERKYRERESIRQFCDGQLTPIQIAELPWGNREFCCAIASQLAFKHRQVSEELERHRTRFKVLREVFGPDVRR